MKVIEEVQSEINEFISPIFISPKKNGEYRIIFNLKELNKHIEYQHFKMDTFESTLDLIEENSYMSIINLKHAYYTVNIAEQHRKFLRFIWKGKYFQYSCLPFGIAMAPRLFTKLMKVVFASLRKLGYVNIGYIDDSLLIGDTLDECKDNVEKTVSLVTKLGFLVNDNKSVFTPRKQIRFLGFDIDSEKMIVTLPVEKQNIIAEESSKLHVKKECKIREVARVLGLLISSFSAVDYGKLYYRNIEVEKIKALKFAKCNFEAEMAITPDMIIDLQWSSENIYSQSRKINRGNPQVTIQTDASNEGWGAILNAHETGSRWNGHDTINHINYLEFLAIYYALKSFKNKLLTVNSVKILTDNTTAVSYINNMGGIKSEKCNKLARTIWHWCIGNQIWLTATHIPGKFNTKADHKSRNFNDQLEWQLNKAIFEQLCSLWPKPEIDLFASHLNTQLPVFCSWNDDPESSFVDAFTLDWIKYYNYIFPPFSMVGHCVKKIITDKADVLFIGPIWPIQPWFVQVMKLNRPSVCTYRSEKHVVTTVQRQSSPSREFTELDGMSSIRKHLQDTGISEKKTSAIIMASWISGTQKQYKTYIRKWFLYCNKRKTDRFHTSVELVLDFLTCLYNSGLSYSALNSARSALSVFGLTFDNGPVGKHPLVVRFLKGVFNLRPTIHNDVNIWDVSIVLSYLKRLSPVPDISLKRLDF